MSAFVFLASASTVFAGVTWKFTETSLTFAFGGMPVPHFVPRVAGFLTVSDSDLLAGGISYSFLRGPDGTTVGGNQDFSFLGFTEAFLPRDNPDALVGDRDASADLAFDAAGDLSGFVQEDLEFVALRMSITDNRVESGDGTIATDGSDLQCPDTLCDFTGFWTIVPEPGSGMVLTIALALAGLLQFAAHVVPLLR
ncbi:MAG TPA: hypothetical protein VGF34_07280 [Stellaceae bacterium]